MPTDPIDGSYYEDSDPRYQKTEDELEFDQEAENTSDEYYKTDFEID